MWIWRCGRQSGPISANISRFVLHSGDCNHRGHSAAPVPPRAIKQLLLDAATHCTSVRIRGQWAGDAMARSTGLVDAMRRTRCSSTPPLSLVRVAHLLYLSFPLPLPSAGTLHYETDTRAVQCRVQRSCSCGASAKSAHVTSPADPWPADSPVSALAHL